MEGGWWEGLAVAGPFSASGVRASAHGGEADAAQGFEIGQALVLGAHGGLDGVEAREQGMERLAHDGEGCKRLVGVWMRHGRYPPSCPEPGRAVGYSVNGANLPSEETVSLASR